MSEESHRKAFAKLDKSGDGFLDAMEIQTFMKGVCPHVTDAQIAEYVVGMSPDSKQISFEQFYAKFKMIDVKSLTEDDFKKQFKKLDKNGDGTVDAAEAEILLASCEHFTPEMAAEQIKKFDKNGDGVLNCDEFLTMWAEAKK